MPDAVVAIQLIVEDVVSRVLLGDAVIMSEAPVPPNASVTTPWFEPYFRFEKPSMPSLLEYCRC